MSRATIEQLNKLFKLYGETTSWSVWDCLLDTSYEEADLLIKQLENNHELQEEKISKLKFKGTKKELDELFYEDQEVIDQKIMAEYYQNILDECFEEEY
jgi:hypothetical protein